MSSGMVRQGSIAGLLTMALMSTMTCCQKLQTHNVYGSLLKFRLENTMWIFSGEWSHKGRESKLEHCKIEH